MILKLFLKTTLESFLKKKLFREDYERSVFRKKLKLIGVNSE